MRPKKEKTEKERYVRIVFRPDAYEKLEKQADVLGQTVPAFCRYVVMEKVIALALAQSSVEVSEMKESIFTLIEQIKRIEKI